MKNNNNPNIRNIKNQQRSVYINPWGDQKPVIEDKMPDKYPDDNSDGNGDSQLYSKNNRIILS